MLYIAIAYVGDTSFDTLCRLKLPQMTHLDDPPFSSYTYKGIFPIQIDTFSSSTLLLARRVGCYSCCLVN